VPPAAANDYPGKSDGFVRSVNEKGEEVYTLDCGNATKNMASLCGQAEHEGQAGVGCMQTNTCVNNQVYVVPANDYYAWHSQCDSVSERCTLLHLPCPSAPLSALCPYHPTDASQCPGVV
jgi:hypothetical protein